ncbi:protein LOL2 [Mangifera indica]|uniref:protein LOL2 n=1 Tax=Mangifera indica TaxID=29780 RepID=UPI001CF9A179|nr:protein LOL2 [Mangifera indica]
MENKEEKESTEKPEEEDDDDGPPPGWQQPILPPPAPASAAPQLRPSSSEMAQMVCGSCRRLLAYPQGAKYVKCSCCQTINFVLEAHQVGQVMCTSCAVLLMYPYGAPSVRCSTCHVVTEIGDHNRRPPWSVQQGQPTPPGPAC